jgi:hypothetical protein
VIKNGSAASELAADAQHCIMGLGCLRTPAEYKAAARFLSCPSRVLPSYRHPDTAKRAAVLEAV